MNGIIIGQYLPGFSFWHRLDPRAKMIITCIFIVSCFLIQSWPFILLLVGLELLAMSLTRIPFSYFARSLKPILFFIILTVILQISFINQGEPMFSLGYFQITDEGLSRGLFMALRLVVVVIVSTLLTLTTKPADLTLALESLLDPLRKIKIPVSELALMISIALRFVPTLFAETQKILKSQASRGVDITEGKLKEKVVQLISLLVPLFILSFKRADELADAMEVRGYVPGKSRTSINLLTWKRVDSILVIVGLIVFLIAIIF